MAGARRTVPREVHRDWLVLLGPQYVLLMTLLIQCENCGHRKAVTEHTYDSGIERVAVSMKLSTYPPCSVCGKTDWKIVEPDNPMAC
jgi:hypothetical protein